MDQRLWKLKVSGENGENTSRGRRGQCLLDSIPTALYALSVSTEWDCLKLKGFYTAKGRIRVKDTAPRMVENS